MKYFKVYTDFTKYIPIDETEIEKALYAFQLGKPVIFENGAANRIESIIPDYNKSLGWFSDYKPTPDDNQDLEKVRNSYTGYLGLVKEKIQYLISSNQVGLIGKNIELPEFKRNSIPERSSEVKRIGDLLPKNEPVDKPLANPQ